MDFIPQSVVGPLHSLVPEQEPELATREDVEDLRMLVSKLWDVTQELRREIAALKEERRSV